jgi:hypothetical protein
VLAKYVRVDPPGDGRVGVAKPGGYYVDGDPGKQQSCGMRLRIQHGLSGQDAPYIG